MDKGLTIPKWVLINGPKIPQNLSAQFVCPRPKGWDFDEKGLYWRSVVCDSKDFYLTILSSKLAMGCCPISFPVKASFRSVMTIGTFQFF
jgi:hypothetical protein